MMPQIATIKYVDHDKRFETMAFHVNHCLKFAI